MKVHMTYSFIILLWHTVKLHSIRQSNNQKYFSLPEYRLTEHGMFRV